MSTPSQPQAQQPQSVADPHPKPSELLHTGISQDSPSTIRRALDVYAQNSRRGLDATTMNRALNSAVAQAKPAAVRYLLDETDVKVSTVTVGSVGRAAADAEEGVVEEVLEVLVGTGWDVNCGDGDGGSYSTDGHHPIYRVCHSDRLVRWFLSHGAQVTFPGPDVRGNPPLLEVVARRGTVTTFKLLREHNAPLGLRCLHSAIESAAFAARDEHSEKEAQRMKIVRFLAEEMGCDVNGRDVPEGLMPGNHYGTPLNYAAHTGGGAEAVQYLLDKGADPSIKDCYGMGDAFTYAKGNVRADFETMKDQVTNLLTKWKKDHEEERT